MRWLLILMGFVALSSPCPAQDVVIGSKSFPENRLLGEMLKLLIETHTDLEVEHRSTLGGTVICWNALKAGEIDIYVEYTGTAWAAILKEPGKIADPLRAFLHVQRRSRQLYDVEWLPPFGLNNTYALALRRDKAETLNITRISDLVERGRGLQIGCSIEFLNREDGWAGLTRHYPGLDVVQARTMEHALAYEALGHGQIDLVDAYSTDGKLQRYDVVVLEDDRAFFPPYNAAPVIRGDTLRKRAELRDIIGLLAFRISDTKAVDLNYRVEAGGEEFDAVARSFLTEIDLLEGDALTVHGVAERGLWSVLWGERGRLAHRAAEHLKLVFIAVVIAAVAAIPLGIYSTRRPRLRTISLAVASVVQTIPSLALLAFLIAVPFLGLGATSAVIALALYAILPILRNTITGLESVDATLIDAAEGLGLTPGQVLTRVQLPIAIRTILAGVRTAAVISVGVATLAAFIGAGGLGTSILEGLYLNNMALVLAGALPAAALALAVDAVLGVVERKLTPRGLRADG